MGHSQSMETSRERHRDAANGRSFRHRKAFASWLALYGLLLQALVPVGQAIPMARAVPNGGAQYLFICSALNSISESRSQAPNSQQDRTPSSQCSVCLSFGLGGSLLAPPTVALTLPTTINPLEGPATVVTVLTSRTLAVNRARAPPLSA
ncbi:MAG: DUF2946 domain-containing protein [Alphaproteobacteria bacterium]|nr:DUF2946 domain-containing protein [Alphaproteobacteria bacterium]